MIELAEKEQKGIINVASPTKCSKLDFGLKIATIFDLDKSYITPITVDQKKFIAKRPKNTTLSTKKAKKILKTKLLSVDSGIKKMKELIDSGYVNKLKK